MLELNNGSAMGSVGVKLIIACIHAQEPAESCCTIGAVHRIHEVLQVNKRPAIFLRRQAPFQSLKYFVSVARTVHINKED
jgi:hypothetical protein